MEIPNSYYRILLLSDKQLADGAVCKYTLEDTRSQQTGLDSTLFGANTTRNEICVVCKNNIDNCPGHYGVIELPVPIIKAIVKNACLTLIPCLCPLCSHLLIRDEVLNEIKKLKYTARLRTVKEQAKIYVSKYNNTLIPCPHCKENITSPIIIDTKYKYDFVPLFMIKSPETLTYEYVNPIHVYSVLQNFKQIEEIGYSEQSHPRNFMTSYLPIIASKLRAKSFVNGMETTSQTTNYYKRLLEDVVPDLIKIKNLTTDKQTLLIDKSCLNDFIEAYSVLYGYYMLITDPSSERTQEKLIQLLTTDTKYRRKMKLNFDDTNCLINRFKGKERSIFSKGMVRMIHDVCARIVLGSAVDTPMTDLVLPYTVCNSLMIYNPVYNENLRFMKNLIKRMENKEIYNNIYVPKVYGVYNSSKKRFQRVEPSNADMIAQTLSPGDKVGMTLCNNDFVIQSRHPAIREESLTSFLVRKDTITTMNIPTTVCEIKQADFDGDETQIYLASSHSTDIESLLLHSVQRQLKSFDTGNFSFFYASAHDDDLGVSRIADIPISYHKHHTIKPTSVLTLMENEILPKDLNYTSSDLIIKNGIIDRTKTNFRTNKNFYKYYESVYGSRACCNLIDYITQIGYEINRVYGATLGFEIKLFTNRKNEIKKMIFDATKRASEIIKKNGVASISSINEIEKIKPFIQTEIVKAAEGQNLSKNNYTKNRASEYYVMTVLPNHVNIGGSPVLPMLDDNTRTSACGYCYSYDPIDYGFVDIPYVNDMNPMSHYFVMMEEMRGIYDRTSGTAKQGYMSNRMGILFERAYTDFNGCLVDGDVLLSPQYGVCGLDSRIEFRLPMNNLKLKTSEFEKLYDDKRLVYLHKYINENMEQYKNITSFINQPITYTFETGFDFEQIFETYGIKGKNNIKDIDAFINEIYSIYIPDVLHNNIVKLDENFIDHEYYFREKFSNYKLTNEVVTMIKKYITQMFTNAGDSVGLKSALAASAPLTQALLSAIHNASAGGVNVDLVIRPSGMTSFEELIGGGRCKDDIIITIVLNDDTQESCYEYALEHETFYYNEIVCKQEIVISNKINDVLLKMYGNKINDTPRNIFYIKATWNMVKISKYNIRISKIINELISNYKNIVMILPYLINSEQVCANIYFNESMSISEIHKFMFKCNNYNDENIINGGYLKNCYVVENINRPGHYVIEANDVKQIIIQQDVNKTKTNRTIDVLRNLMFDPRVNPCLCKTTEPNDNIKIFGINEGECRHYDRLIFTAQILADTRSCLNRVYKTITSVMTARGKLTFATGNSLLKDEYPDTLTSMKFQEAGKFIRKHCQKGDWTKINQYIPSMILGETPNMGVGVSKVMIFPK